MSAPEVSEQNRRSLAELHLVPGMPGGNEGAALQALALSFFEIASYGRRKALQGAPIRTKEERRPARRLQARQQVFVDRISGRIPGPADRAREEAVRDPQRLGLCSGQKEELVCASGYPSTHCGQVPKRRPGDAALDWRPGETCAEPFGQLTLVHHKPLLRPMSEGRKRPSLQFRCAGFPYTGPKRIFPPARPGKSTRREHWCLHQGMARLRHRRRLRHRGGSVVRSSPRGAGRTRPPRCRRA